MGPFAIILCDLVLFRFLLVFSIGILIANSVANSYGKIHELLNRIALLEFRV